MATAEMTALNIETGDRGQDNLFGLLRLITMTPVTPFLAEAQEPAPPAVPPPTHGQLWPRGVYPD